MAIVVSIVSGKGGSGKSLLAAVLGRALAREGERVLLVDMDIFVRGLTVLLFGYNRPERKDGSITVSDLLGVFSEDSASKGPVTTEHNQLMIQRFFECDVLPSVDNIGAPLDYDDKTLSDESFCTACVKGLLASVQDLYDYVLIDNRAGMDSLIAASCRCAQIVVSVAEDDDVGRQTNANLTRFLQTRKNVRIVYTILNKGRRIHTYSDLTDHARHRHEFTMLGVIPFDMDILEEFGSERFWTTVMETLYFRAVLDAWNALAKLESVRELSVSKYRFPPKLFMQNSDGRYTLVERMLRVYSMFAMMAGVLIWFYRQVLVGKFDRYEMTAVMSIFFGAVGLGVSTSAFRALLRGRMGERKDTLQE